MCQKGGKFFNDAFVGHKSHYMKLFVYFLGFAIGYKLYNSGNAHQARVSMLREFQGPNAFPPNIQKMLENNDFRYAREFLQEPASSENKN